MYLNTIYTWEGIDGPAYDGGSLGVGGDMTTELTTTRDRERGVRGEGAPVLRTPPEIRVVLRRLRYLVRALRAEQKERGVAYDPASTEPQRALYRALIQAEHLIEAYKAGAFRKERPDPVVD